MDSRVRLTAEQDPLLMTAADWFTRLQEAGVSLEVVADWHAWMSADARHAEAYRSIEDLWHDFALVPVPEAVSAAAQAADRYVPSMAVGQWNARARDVRSAGWAIAASLVMALAMALVLWRPWSALGSEVFETQVGENRTITLEDGSRLALGGRTTIRVSFSKQARELTLVRGEAFFDVARDSTRPFSVRAGDATVIAVGTQFNVRCNDDRVVVSVVEGKVVVERTPGIFPALLVPGGRDGARRPLPAGRRATIAAGADLAPRSEPVQTADATAWRSGRLAFESEPLRYVIQDVNRYSQRPIELADERIGNLLITGTVRDDSIPAWLASLEPAFGIRVIDEPARVVLANRQ